MTTNRLIDPKMPPYTKKQGQYLSFIYHYTKLHRRPPAEADIQRHFRVTPPTVHGMIKSFSVIAQGGSTPKADKLALGISTALFTTLVGLAIAIPAIAAYNILKNRVARLVLEVGILSEGLMSRFENVGATKKQ